VVFAIGWDGGDTLVDILQHNSTFAELFLFSVCGIKKKTGQWRASTCPTRWMSCVLRGNHGLFAHVGNNPRSFEILFWRILQLL